MEDQELLASLKRGNNHAFGLLVNKYKDMVFSICVKITEDFHLAEEAAQDTFMKVYHQHARYKGEAKFSSWLYRIAINTSYNKIRQRKPLDSIEGVEREIQDQDVESGFEKLAKEDRLKSINLALSQLDKLDALVLSLFYLEELSIEELASICELSVANVKVKLHRGRKKLKLAIQDLLNNEIESLK
ncbi:MAG: sigma-70 family RNA polymerase sigma factor [Chitinophagales bacterium]|nr:sigma-70 family RNA polymerase sigma factor [Bacteroidota bacterium]MCB9256335.1 sigma-70 family RNA polymerase sigma factor [Chitinophagales bacterium]